MFFVTYADNRELRKQMAIALAPKAFKTTNLTIRKMLKLPNCDLIAQVLLIAHFVLEERMAENPESKTFATDQCKSKAGRNEIAELTAFAKKLDELND
jgi:peptidyl-dipeptidase Dcp